MIVGGCWWLFLVVVFAVVVVVDVDAVAVVVVAVVVAVVDDSDDDDDDQHHHHHHRHRHEDEDDDDDFDGDIHGFFSPTKFCAEIVTHKSFDVKNTCTKILHTNRFTQKFFYRRFYRQNTET